MKPQRDILAYFQQGGKLTVQRALLGISGTDLHNYIEAQKRKDEKFTADFGTNDGVYVAEVLEDGAAAEAGLKEGDVIIAVDGRKVTKMSELQETTTRYRPGDKALIRYIRDKKEKTTTITFRNEKGNTNVVKAQNMDILGAEFTPLTDSQKKSLNLTYGIQVSKLKAGRLKDQGIPEGFIILKVNGTKITNEDIKKWVTDDARKPGDMTTIEIKGRHDPCIVPRAVPVVEAAAAIAIFDAWLEYKARS